MRTKVTQGLHLVPERYLKAVSSFNGIMAAAPNMDGVRAEYNPRYAVFVTSINTPGDRISEPANMDKKLRRGHIAFKDGHEDIAPAAWHAKSEDMPRKLKVAHQLTIILGLTEKKDLRIPNDREFTAVKRYYVFPED